MHGEVSKGRGPSLCPLAPTSFLIPLLYDLFYEHGLAASTLPWEPAWCGLPAAPSGIGNFKSGADPGGGDPKVGVYGVPEMHVTCLSPCSAPDSRYLGAQGLRAGRSWGSWSPREDWS